MVSFKSHNPNSQDTDFSKIKRSKAPQVKHKPPNVRIPLNPGSADQRQTLSSLLKLKNPRAKPRLARERRGMCEEVRCWVRFDSQRAGGSQWSPKESADAASQESPKVSVYYKYLKENEMMPKLRKVRRKETGPRTNEIANPRRFAA